MPGDTICAPATAPVNSSLALIRISGPEAYGAAFSIFTGRDKIAHRLSLYGSIMDGESIVDDVILVYYTGPASFTGEDMVEISCHGNPIVVSRIIRLLDKLNIRMAEPGEFSKRAFLNGKIDLTKAEAINSLINARSDWEIKTSISQMHGSLKEKVDELKGDLILLKADVEAGIDFLDQDIEFISYSAAVKAMEDIRGKILDLKQRCSTGERVSRGIDVILAGRPNVGKSSLLNLMLNEERAIVSDIPGTTRDLIRETVQIGGVRINLTDTAGLGKARDDIEKIGIELSHKKINDASLVLMVIDARDGITEKDREIIAGMNGKKHLFLLNKTDVADEERLAEIESAMDEKPVRISAKTGKGLHDLEEAVSSVIAGEFVDYENSFLADMRIMSILEKAADSSGEAVRIMKEKELPEIVAFELNDLTDLISDITGEITPDDVLGSIFSRFCIGK